MDFRVLDQTKLKRDGECPFCKTIKPAGSEIEIIQDVQTGKQYAHWTCKECKENVVIR